MGKKRAEPPARNKGDDEEMNYTKNSIVGEILDKNPDLAPIFLAMGMHCLGCPASRGETLEQACMVHGQDPDAILAKLNQHAGA